MLDKSLQGQVQEFLDGFGKALEKGDIEAVCEMFADEGYWRDLVSFTWNIKTMEGKSQIGEMLNTQLESVKPTDWRVADNRDRPSERHAGGSDDQQPDGRRRRADQSCCGEDGAVYRSV